VAELCLRLQFPFVYPFRDESGDTIQPISKIKFLVSYCMTHRQHTFAQVQVIEDSMTMGTVLTKKILQEASKTFQSPITMQELTKAMQKLERRKSPGRVEYRKNSTSRYGASLRTTC
jgi:hypothetical protein